MTYRRVPEDDRRRQCGGPGDRAKRSSGRRRDELGFELADSERHSVFSSQKRVPDPSATPLREARFGKSAVPKDADVNKFEISCSHYSLDLHVKVLGVVEDVAPLLVTDAAPFQVPRIPLLADQLPALGANWQVSVAAEEGVAIRA